MQLAAGLYRHYKGREYRVYGVARHSETEEAMVVYQALYGDYGLWVRPLAMFLRDRRGEWPAIAALRADVREERVSIGLRCGRSGD